jgi:predicted phage-related endonuclease
MTTTPEIYTSRDAWLAARVGSLGASEVAGLLGHSRYCSPLSLYLRERARIAGKEAPAVEVEPDDEDDAEEDDERLEAGLAYEGVNAERYSKRTGRRLLSLGGSSTIYRHPSGLRLHASPDAVQAPTSDDLERFPNRVGHAAVELKHWGAPPSTWREAPPLSVAIQGLVQAECMGAQWFTCAAVLQGVRLVYHDQDHHRELAAQILERVADFWSGVERGIEPPASAQDVGFLREWYTESWGGSEVLTVPDGAAWLEQLRLAQAQQKDAKDRINALKAEAMQALGSAETLFLDGQPIATWKEQDAPIMQKVGTRRARVFRWKK